MSRATRLARRSRVEEGHVEQFARERLRLIRELAGPGKVERRHSALRGR